MRQPWARLVPEEPANPLETAHIRLAAALCSLPFVPFPVLRAVRRFVCPEVSEQRFCDSNLVDGVSADGISLDLSFGRQLRERVRLLYADAKEDQDRAAVGALRELLDAHGRILSPLLAVEERILWTWLTTVDPGALRAACDLQLRDVIGTAIFENRQRIYRWASAAAQRLPIECFDGELGWILGQLCRTRQIRFPAIDLPADAFSDRTLLDAMAAGLPDRLLGVYRDGDYLELGPVDSRRHVAIPVVDTDPIAVDVTAAPQGRRATLWLHHRRAVRLPVGRAAVTLRDLRGQTYTLPEFGGDEAPETAEARTALENAIAYQANGEFVRFEVLRPAKTGYVVSLPDLGCTAFLAESEATLRPGDEGLVSVVNVIADQRRVIVRLPAYNPVDAISDRTLPRAGIASDVPRRFQAQVLKLGKTRGAKSVRAVHVVLPPDHPLWPLPHDGVGRIRFPAAAYKVDDSWEPQPGTWVDVVVVAEDERFITLRLDLGPDHPRTVPSPYAVRPPRRPRQQAPWPDVETLTAGQRLALPITSVVNFGVFLQLPDGRSGLLHVTRMFPKQKRGEIQLRTGDTINVEVESIDAAAQRIVLTQEHIWEPVPVGQEMELHVVKTVPFGVFLELPDGRSGLLHVSEMTPPQAKGEIPYRPGDRLRVRVISEDRELRRIGFAQLP
jgi:predicted RNA-binding protein with RPS1 domain